MGILEKQGLVNSYCYIDGSIKVSIFFSHDFFSQ